MTDIDRLKAKYKKDQSTGCWNWFAGADDNGYGRFWLGSKVILASHASWILHKGSIPRGVCVLHKCDNPPCINPAHLFLGDRRDNIRDCINKGRNSKPPIHSGETHHKAKLTTEEVRKIREKYIPRIYSTRKLAKEFNISQGVIAKIVRHELWVGV